MKRLAYEIIWEEREQVSRIVEQTVHALKSAGIEVRTFSLLDRVLPEVYGKQTMLGDWSDLRSEIEKRQGEYDEIWLLTDAFVGPVHPLDGMLKKLDALKADVWQLTRCSGFYGLRKKALESPAVLEWISRGMPDQKLPAAVGRAKLTLKEAFDTTDIADASDEPLLDEPVVLLAEKGCPFFMHQVFHRDYGDTIENTLGHMGPVLYRYLKDTAGFDLDPLWDYLLTTCHQEDLFWSMHLQYTLSTSVAPRARVKKHLKDHKLCLGMHLYYTDLLPQSLAWAKMFPPETDVIITTSDGEKKRIIEKTFAGSPFHSVQVRVIGNRGRDVSALLIGMRDVEDYDYVCFFHDKKVLQTKPGTVGMGFAYLCTENLFGSPDYVLNVVDLFARNPRLGLLTPPPPNHADYFFTLGVNWGPNYEQTRELHERLDLTVPIDEAHMPLAPLGTCFWFRGKALALLLDYPWEYRDFPPEPNNVDGTLLHAVERIYPFAVQESGFYPAYGYSDRFAALQYTNMRYYVRGYQQVLVKHQIMNKPRKMCQMAWERLARR